MGAGYDALSRLQSLSHTLDPGGTPTDLLKFNYAGGRDLNGLLTDVTESGSAVSAVLHRTYGYDPLSRLTRARRYSDAAGTVLLKDAQWTLSAAGDWQSVDINPPPATTLTYDRTATSPDPVTGNHRLKAVTAVTTVDLSGTVSDGLGTLTVTVDGEGVTPSRDTGPSPDTWTVTAADVDPGPNAVHAEADGQTADQTLTALVAGAGTYEYDANGNRTQYNAADDSVQRYVYDRENRLTTIYYDATASAPRSEFTYDGLGRRIGVTEYDALGAVTSAQRYLYDGLDLVEVRDASDDTLAQFVHGPGIDNPLVMVDVTQTPADLYYYHTDHLGSVRLITDDTGAEARTYDYSAYGVLIAESGTGASLNPFHYTGREYHAPSGLYFYRARWYDPEVGSFVSVDPLGLNGGSNPYAYVGLNPVTYLDPLGLLRKDVKGNVIFVPARPPFIATHPSGRRSTLQGGYVTADDGTKIPAYTNLKVSPTDPGFDTDCHGQTFAGGNLWINNADAQAILKGDGYKKLSSVRVPTPGDVAIYRNSKGDIVHSGRVTGMDPTTHVPIVIGLGGMQQVPSSKPAVPGPGGAWPDATATVEYWSR